MVTDKSLWSTCVLISDLLLHEKLQTQEIEILETLYDEIIPVDLSKCDASWIENNRESLALLERPELAFTFLKLELWGLTQFEKVLYLDSDVLLLRKQFFDILELTQAQTSDEVGAVPDCGWPDLFNTGVMVIMPSNKIHKELLEFVALNISLDGADQGVLNQFFNPNCRPQGLGTKSWIRLPFLFNVTVPNAGYQRTPAVKFFQNEINLVHFIGKDKPWLCNSLDQFRRKWWLIYGSFLQTHFPIEEYAVENALQSLSIESGPAQSDIDDDDDNSDELAVASDEQGSPEELIEIHEDCAWDATKEPPPKDGKPEAATIDLDTEFAWNDSEALLNDNLPETEAVPDPIFPWELNRNLSEVERVFPVD